VTYYRDSDEDHSTLTPRMSRGCGPRDSDRSLTNVAAERLIEATGERHDVDFRRGLPKVLPVHALADSEAEGAYGLSRSWTFRIAASCAPVASVISRNHPINGSLIPC